MTSRCVFPCICSSGLVFYGCKYCSEFLIKIDLVATQSERIYLTRILVRWQKYFYPVKIVKNNKLIPTIMGL